MINEVINELQKIWINYYLILNWKLWLCVIVDVESQRKICEYYNDNVDNILWVYVFATMVDFIWEETKMRGVHDLITNKYLWTNI